MRLKTRSKFNALPTMVGNIKFASKREAKRYQELLLLERAQQAWGLELQPKYVISVNGVKVATYIADFRYYEVDARGKSTLVAEDVKGFRTPVYRLKKKLVEAIYGIEIREI